jgi:hypothetical protein
MTEIEVLFKIYSILKIPLFVYGQTDRQTDRQIEGKQNKNIKDLFIVYCNKK